MSRRILNGAIGTLVSLMAVTSACWAQDQCLDAVKERGVLVSANGVLGLKPYVWKNEATGQYEGFEAEILAEIANRIGVDKWDYAVTEWSTMIPGMKAGRWDIIISSMFANQERIQGADIAFTNPYFRLYNVVTVLKDSPIQTIDDLKGKTVASVLGTMDSANAHVMKDKGQVAEVLDFNGFGEPFQALRSGQAAAVVLDHGSYHAQQEELGDIRTVGEPMDYHPKPEWADAEAKASYILGSLAIGVRKECSDLTGAINQALADMEADGTRKKILEKYDIWSEQQTVLTK
uniref:substrate-binding periplasmic protein n=1 Tax=Aminobacter niigataensis TaxID=83265 RepID=UPI002852B56F|nr:ABC transporter substrate-binding protein [Aminobacter niigataensis]WMD00134.1 ABC transporter substrate-binding protein [Aminobacter niigataensis]